MDIYMVLSVIVMAATVLVSLLSIFTRIRKPKEKTDRDDKNRNPDKHLENRINTANAVLKRIHINRTLFRIIYGVLITIELFVGLCLISTVFTSALNETSTGILGLVVVIATIVHEIFKPVRKYEEFDRKYIKLHKIIDEVVDERATDKDCDRRALIKELTAAIHEAVAN